MRQRFPEEEAERTRVIDARDADLKPSFAIGDFVYRPYEPQRAGVIIAMRVRKRGPGLLAFYGHGVWNGNGRPWRYAATEYWAVEVEAEPVTKDGLLIADGLARIVRREEPGKNWRRVLVDLTAWMKTGAA